MRDCRQSADFTTFQCFKPFPVDLENELHNMIPFFNQS